MRPVSDICNPRKHHVPHLIQTVFTCTKPTMKTPEQCVKSVQS